MFPRTITPRYIPSFDDNCVIVNASKTYALRVAILVTPLNAWFAQCLVSANIARITCEKFLYSHFWSVFDKSACLRDDHWRDFLQLLVFFHEFLYLFFQIGRVSLLTFLGWAIAHCLDAGFVYGLASLVASFSTSFAHSFVKDEFACKAEVPVLSNELVPIYFLGATVWNYVSQFQFLLLEFLKLLCESRNLAENSKLIEVTLCQLGVSQTIE